MVFGGLVALHMLRRLWSNERFARWMDEAALLEHIKIVVGFFQVVSPLGSVLSLSLKDDMPALYRIVHCADALWIDLSVFVRLDCLPAFADFYTHWCIDVFGIPTMLFGAVGVSHCWATWGQTSREAINRAQERSRTLCFALCFLIYPRVSMRVFQMLACQRLGENEMWLEADYRVDCETDEFRVFWLLAIAVVALVPVGVPGCLLTKLIGVRTQRAQHDDSDCEQGKSDAEHDHKPAPRKYAMITRSYCAECMWWEPIDWLRKMFLGGLLMLLERGSVVQVFTGTCISFVFAVVHAAVRPYRKKATNWLKGFVEMQVFLAFLISFAMRLAGTLDAQVLDWSDYERLLVITFVSFVPGAFVVCTMATSDICSGCRRCVRRQQVEVDDPLGVRNAGSLGSVQTRCCSCVAGVAKSLSSALLCAPPTTGAAARDLDAQLLDLVPEPEPVKNAPGRWDAMISYTQRNPTSEALAYKISAALQARGKTVWLDVDMGLGTRLRWRKA